MEASTQEASIFLLYALMRYIKSVGHSQSAAASTPLADLFLFHKNYYRETNLLA